MEEKGGGELEKGGWSRREGRGSGEGRERKGEGGCGVISRRWSELPFVLELPQAERERPDDLNQSR